MGSCQEKNITTALYETYDEFREESIEKRRIKYKDIQPLIAKYAANSKFKVQVVGKSIEGRDLSLISIGTGKTSVFLWSQMHGIKQFLISLIF